MNAIDILDDWLLSDLAVDFRVNDAGEIVCGIGNDTATGEDAAAAIWNLHSKRYMDSASGPAPRRNPVSVSSPRRVRNRALFA